MPLVEKIEHYHHQKNRICLWNSLNTLNKKNEEVIISHVVSSWVLIDDRLPDVEEGRESPAAATHKAFLCDDNMSGLKIIWVDYFLSFSFLSIGPNRVRSLPCLDSNWLVKILADSILADVADVDNVENVVAWSESNTRNRIIAIALNFWVRCAFG